MVGSIPKLYQEYRKRLEDVDMIERELLRTDNLEDWLERLNRKSDLIRKYYKQTEKEINTLINPILYGEKPLDDKTAKELYEGAYAYYENVMCDDVMESQMFVRLWEYYESQGDEFNERSCRCAFSNNAFLNVEGNLRKLAMEQADWVSSYMDRIDHLRRIHANDEDFFMDVKRVLGTLRSRYEMESSQFEPDISRMIACFNDMSKIRKYRSYFSDAEWESIEKPLQEVGADVCFMAVLHWNSVDEKIKEALGPTYPLGFIEQIKLPAEERDMKVYVGYIVYAFYTGLLKPEQTFTLLRAYSHSVENEYDFNAPNWFDQPAASRFGVITTTTKPMLEMIEAFNCDKAKKIRMKAELFYEIQTYIETIPRECKCKEYLDQALYHLLYDLIPFIDEDDMAIEFIDCMIISRQMATLIHTVMTAKLSETVLKALIAKRPEMFLEVLGIDDPDEVAEYTEFLKKLMYNAARCHDIGKILIANIVNTQIRRLSDMEYSYIKFHPKWSYEILMRNRNLQPYAEIALGHHRSFDGKSGYPMYFNNRKSKFRILIDLLTVCDCMDAATDVFGRNYTKGKTFESVMAEFSRSAGTHYNPEIVDFIVNNEELKTTLREMTSEAGRADRYFHIYRRYR